MSFLTLAFLDFTLHLVWNIIEDKVPFLRRITHTNIICESTDLLTAQIEAIKPSLKQKLNTMEGKEDENHSYA